MFTLLCASAAMAAPEVWELHGSRWVQATTSPVAVLTDEPVLDRAEKMIQSGNYLAGANTAIQWVKDHKKDNPQRDRGLMLIAQGLYQDGKRVDAFYYLDELMDEVPDSKYYPQALQLQYDIADQYLKGYKRVFIFMPILDATDEAIDMLFRIQQRAPGSRLAEKALLRTADYYYANSEYDLAADAYGAYLKSYPRSPQVPQLRLRRAYATLAQFRGTRYDATPLIDAKAQLTEIAAAYPEIAQDEGLMSLIMRIDETFAQKVYRHADWYRRTSQPSAAVYNYRFLIATFPKSPEAKLSKERLKEFPEKILAERPPRKGSGYSPATMPYPEER